MVGSMKIFTGVFVGSMLLAAVPKAALAQASYGAEAYAARQQEEERWRKLSAQVEEFTATQESLRKRIATLEAENNSLRSEITKAGNAGVSPEEFQRVIKQLTDKLKEIDDKRVQDNKTVLENVRQMIRDLKPTTVAPTPPPSTKASDPLPPTQKGYPYTIQSGQTLSAIIKAFKEQGVNTSLDAILKANPGLKPKSMQVGQEIFVPEIK